ncbi:type I restriction enzyme S subunit [Maribacter vaceletii]|uniref:Type I restriction enzyme S subunit n=1 Tax=Maribacter vaceletii TaxID=1206816 RepID=A0A495EG56_9FLAO|nr:restriction endonuclease subunit S [Maribacter vaceletii]RKR14907.1 type I restriction enzyme S subunit [Maribacter vaceletii]
MQLLQHFKELTVRPKNAQELKGLILQLAIQGKLTANWRKENPDIEPASELLNRIQKEKEQLVKEKKIKKEKAFRILDDKPLFTLPINWEYSYLGDLGYAQTGTTPPTKNPNNYGSFIPFLGPANISNSSMEYPLDGLSEEGLKKGRLIEVNSLMMVCIGGSMGKCNVNTKDVSCNQQINVLTTICSPIEYIKIVCQSPYFQKEVWDRSTGSATPMINKSKWLQIPVFIPPLEEQKEIVKVVKTLFKEVEQLEQLTVERISLKEDFVASALNQLTTNNANQEWAFLQEHFKSFFNETANIKKLRETVLQLAVQGKLTADWRAKNTDTEDASVLLKHIQKEKAQLIKDKKIKKEKALPKITKDEIPYELPEGWVWCRFQNIINEVKGGGTPSKRNSSFWDGNLPWASVKDLKDFRYLEKTQDFITQEGLDNSSANLIPINSLIICTRMGLGKISINKIPTTINQDLKAVSLSNQVDIEFIYDQYKTLSITGSGMTVSGIKQEELLGFLFAIPPLEEQKAIVEKVNALMGLCDSLEHEVQQSQEHSAQLMQSCLRVVFEGENKMVSV